MEFTTPWRMLLLFKNKTFMHIWSCKRAPGCSMALLATFSVAWKKNSRKMGKHNIKTSSQRPSWFGAALVPQGLYSLLSYAEKLILNFFKDVCRGMLAHLFTNWSSTEVGWCNRSNQQQNGISRRKYAFWCGPWSQESASHQTSEKYCWTQTVL